MATVRALKMNGGVAKEDLAAENVAAVKRGAVAILASPDAELPPLDAGIVVVAVDQAVTEPSAYILSNNQEQYAYLGAKWLFETMGATPPAQTSCATAGAR